jgi:glycosyltransferase involved in cell wall biosynthesis
MPPAGTGKIERRILFVDHWPDLRGGQRTLVNLIAGSGDDTRFLVAAPPGSKFNREVTDAGGRLVELKMPPWKKTRRPCVNAAIFFRALWPWRWLAGIIRRENIDLVHANGLFALLTALPPARLARVPVVGHIHAFAGIDHRAAGYVLKRTDRVVAVCGSLADDIKRRWALPEDRLTVVANGVDVDHITARSKEAAADSGEEGKRVGTVTSFDPGKGFDVLLEAFGKIASSDTGPTLTAVGDGPGRDCAAGRAEKAGIGDRVRFTGYLDNPYPVLAGLDLYVSPSLSEASPISILEAMALGVPVLATAVGGVPEMIEHNVSGWLVPPSDPDALVDAMETLLGDEPLRKRLAEAARERVRDIYSAEKMAAGFNDIYRALLPGRLPG